MPKKSQKISGDWFQALTEDHCSILKRAFESYLIWESFGDLIRDVRRGHLEYPRVFFFQPFTLAVVGAAFDSFIINLYKFHDNRSYELETLVDVGVKHGGIEPSLGLKLNAQIKDAASFAAKKNIDSLRNRSIGHYDAMAERRSALTTVHPTSKEIRDYFEKLGAILRVCAAHARFHRLPLQYNQSEKGIRDISKIFTQYIRGEKVS